MNTRATWKGAGRSLWACLAFGQTRARGVWRSIPFILSLITTVRVVGASPAADQPVSARSAAPTEAQGQRPAPKPKPGPAPPEALAAVFGKAVPTSISD